MPEPKRFAVIVAGGKGTRIQSTIPKQFISINETPLICYTINAFIKANPDIEIVVVLPADFLHKSKEIKKNMRHSEMISFIEGGRERFFSVKNALHHIPDNALVAIHDAVRPFVTNEMITKAFELAQKTMTAIPVIPVVSSIRHISKDQNHPVDRNNFFTVQTPQCFAAHILKKAYEQEFQTIFTDDASVVEAYGITLNFYEGTTENIKITTQSDLDFAAWKLSKA